MRTRFLIFLLPLLAAGCGNRLFMNCAEFAPADKEISWTEYNSASACADYFDCYSGTISRHSGDTILIKGRMSDNNFWFEDGDTILRVISDFFVLGDSGEAKIDVWSANGTPPRQYWSKELYLKCFPNYNDDMNTCCAGYYHLISLDTVSH